MEKNNKIYFYPIWLRIWHGLNAIGIIALIITGYSMQSGVESSFIKFSSAVSVHNIAGVLVTLSYFIFLVGNLFTNNSKFYIIKPKGFIKRPMKQARYYIYGMFQGEKSPYPLSKNRKFNPLQKYIYFFVMYVVVPLTIFSGIALLFPEIIIEEVYNLSGIFLTAVFHTALGFFIGLFLIIHLYVASIGKSPAENFKSMINGWHHV